MVSALDPFHDYQQTLNGFPDENAAPSFVQCHTQQVSVVPPASAAGTTWECFVAYRATDSSDYGAAANYYDPPNWPYVDSVHTGTYVKPMAGVDDTGQIVGDLWIGCSAAGGYNCTPLGKPGVGASTDSSYTLFSRLSDCPGRVVGVAFEVYNTTADLYKQGSVTCSLYSNNTSDSTVYYRDLTALSDHENDVTPIAAVRENFPVNEGALRSIPGATTWEAKRGAYVIPRLRTNPKPCTPYVYDRARVLTDGTRVQATCAVRAAAGGFAYYPYAPSDAGFSPAGAWFTGLSEQTTLRVTFRTLVEYFPPPGSSLISLASPSPAQDFQALSMYHAAARSAPWAVPVSMNAGGDYFKMVLGILRNVAATVLKPVGVVASAMTGLPISPFTDALSDFVRPKTKVERDVAGPPAIPSTPAPPPPTRRVQRRRVKRVRARRVKQT